MLEVSKLSVIYGKHHALNDISISVNTGELVVILGANGAGKSSLLRSLVGLCEGEMSGQVSLDGKVISDLNPDEIVQLGVALVPEGRAIFGDLSVEENLKLGAYADRAHAKQAENQALVFELFPKLRERRKQIARTMSGGEQQMVAVGRALMSAPSILMLDEPSLGLSPLLSKELFQALARIREKGIGVLVVEQNAKLSLSVADRGYLIEVGNLVGEDSAENLRRDPAVQVAYLGSSREGVGQAKTKPSQAESNVSRSGKTGSNASAAANGAGMKMQYIQPSGLSAQKASLPFSSTSDMGDLLKRAEQSASLRSRVQVPTAAPTAASPKPESPARKPVKVVNLMQEAPVEHAPSPSQSKPVEDDRIAALLQEFETAASNARLPQSTGSTKQRYADIEHESEPLPTIPVFRKSDIEIFKRDQHGVLNSVGVKGTTKQGKGS